MTLQGLSLIGFNAAKPTGNTFQALNPATGQALPTDYHQATANEVDAAAKLAHKAFQTYRNVSGKDRAAFLRQIADNIEARVEDIKARATAETGLPEGRIAGETGRTTGQLRLFAQVIEEGSWLDARIERAQPDRAPMPKPDIRYMLRPIGPVVVFCASNFPMAFSTAGGDTASALAAGNPVIVKAHHAHPGTAEIVGQAINEAIKSCGMPEGTFSLMYGSGREVGAALVQHPHVKAVGFTGSRSGGRALFDLAAARPEPIPVYAEMSSINPVFLLPSALAGDQAKLAAGLNGSLNLGVGQFCTNPGLVLMHKGDQAKQFRDALAKEVQGVGPATMLHKGIREAYAAGVAQKQKHAEVEAVAVVECDPGPGESQATPALFATSAKKFLADESLADEVFGPSTLLVEADSEEDLLAVARQMEGHLTASVFGSDDEMIAAKDLINLLEQKVGRVLFNQFPTGVEVCHAMVHGGPYPATTDGRSTSVGTAAIYRFARPVCYQNFPAAALPAELRDDNPLGIMRMIDGQRDRK